MGKYLNLLSSQLAASHAGYLHRRITGGVRLQSKWQRRWFFLRDGDLYQYDVGGKLWHFKRDASDTTIRGGSSSTTSASSDYGCTQSFVCHLNLVGGFVVRPRPERDRRYVFELVTKTQPLVVLQAESQDDYNTWMAALTHVMRRNQSPDRRRSNHTYALRTPPSGSSSSSL